MKEKIQGILKERNLVKFGIVWMIFSAVLLLKFYDAEVGLINTTMFAFSYKYGFISRGLIGSVFQFIDYVLPMEIMNYDNICRFVKVSVVVYVILLALLFIVCLMKCRKSIVDELKSIVVFFTIFAIPMFVAYENFGRLDIYCVMLSLMAAILIIMEKAEWMVVIFSALGVMVHQGNVFMFLNIILVLLLYKAMTYEGEKRKKYITLFVASFGVASCLFLYFEFFSHFNGKDVANEIKTIASSLHYQGYFHSDVIDHEILGIDLSYREIPFRVINFVEFPIYLVLIFPYIYYGVRLFKNIICNAGDKLSKWKYIIVAIGAGTILPDLILKCDYGRWMFAIVCYYAVVIIALLGMGDTVVETQLKEMIRSIKQKWSFSILLLGYPILLQPFLDIEISSVSYAIADKLNQLFLHLW